MSAAEGEEYAREAHTGWTARTGLVAWRFLVRFTFLRQLRSKKCVLAFMFFMLLALLVFLGRQLGKWNSEMFGGLVLFGLFQTFFVPMVTLVFGAGALGDEREERTLVHLLSRSLPRSGIYIAKILAVAPLALGYSLGGLLFLSWLSGIEKPGVWETFVAVGPSVFWLTLAYLALFQFFAAAFRHSTVIAVLYVFFIEVLVGRMPGILKRVSLEFYAWSLAMDSAVPLGLGPPAEFARVFVPINATSALIVLVTLTASLLAAGAAYFANREYPEAG